MATAAAIFAVAFFNDKFDTDPRAKAWNLEHLLTGLTKFQERPEKDGKLWSPTLYKEGSKRAKDNVESVSCLVLDFDSGIDPDDFLDSWKPWTYVVHSTFSSTPEVPKWRAVFPLVSPVLGSAWEKAHEKLALALGHGAADPSCKDCSRMFYLPAHPAGATPFAHSNQGVLLDPASIPDIEESEPDEIRSYSTKIRPGDDFEQQMSWEALLEPEGYRKCRNGYRGQVLWTRPGKDRGVSCKTGPGPSGDRFYSWSSSIPNLPVGKALTKFSVLAHLKFNGDFKACADHLRSSGYGAEEYSPTVVSEVREGELRRFHLTDLGNAERFIEIHGQNVRYCHLWGRWLFWDGHRWEIDETGGTKTYEMAYTMVRSMQKEAADSEDEDLRKALGPWAHKCETRSRIENIVAMARTFPKINVVPGQLDSHVNLLNLANGTYDLKEGLLRPHDRRDLLTRLISIPFSETSDCPTWVGFLERVLDNNPGLIRFIFKALGYSLTGQTHEQVFFFLHGSQGNNGKTTFIETILKIVGDYGRQTPTETLMAKKDAGISNDIARLKEGRFVAAPETEDGSRLNEGLIKRLTGGDTITARYMHQEFFEFKPQFKIWMSGNHKPNIRGIDDAIWRRVIAIPFQVVIPETERNPELQYLFWQEREGILGWMIDGCKVWRNERLGRPTAIKVAVDAYREEMDVLGSFLNDCTVVDVSGYIKGSTLYERYTNWTKKTGEWTMPQKKFGQAMQSRGEGSHRTKSGYVYEGRTLVEEDHSHVYRGSSDD